MEELQPHELEALVRELEVESEEESLPPEVETLLVDLQPTRLYTSRRRAAKQLGEVSKSSRQIVLALMMAARSDSSSEVRATAEQSLGAPIHQVVLQQHPGLAERAQMAAQQVQLAARKTIADLPATRPSHFRVESHGDTLRISWKQESGMRNQAVQGPLFLLLLSVILLAVSASWPPSLLLFIWVSVLCVIVPCSGYWMLALLANSTRINVGRNEWIIRRGPLPFPQRYVYLRPERLEPVDCRCVWIDRVQEYKRFRSSDSGASAADLLLGCLPILGSFAPILQGMRKELVVTYKLYVQCADGSDKELLRQLSAGEALYLGHTLQKQLGVGDGLSAQE